jgi:hypothetical protein
MAQTRTKQSQGESKASVCPLEDVMMRVHNTSPQDVRLQMDILSGFDLLGWEFGLGTAEQFLLGSPRSCWGASGASRDAAGSGQEFWKVLEWPHVVSPGLDLGTGGCLIWQLLPLREWGVSESRQELQCS